MAAEPVTSISAEWLKWVAWLDQNKKRVAVWCGSAIAIIAIVSLMVYQKKIKEVRASEALSDITLPISSGNSPEPGTAEALLNLERSYPNTRAGVRALLIAAGLRFVEGNYTEAETLFARVENEYPESEWLPQATLGFAACLAAQNKSTEALAEYEKLQKLYPNDVISNDIKLGLAGLYEKQDKPEEAVKIYQDLLQFNHPAYSSVGAQANLRQEALLKQYPDLMKTNTPVIESTSLSEVMTLTNTAAQSVSNQTISIPLTNLIKATNMATPKAVGSNISVKAQPTPGQTNAVPAGEQ